MLQQILCKTLAISVLLLFQASVQATVKDKSFDHSDWQILLEKHVFAVSDGQTTQVDYAGMLNDRAVLTRYLNLLATVESDQFNRWAQSEQLAFLINAYNAWTVELVLSHWPDISSIKDIGGFFSSPWRKKFIPLLGAKRSLDDIEHGMIREEGRYNDPRIHFAVNCASVGCPALRAQAYVGERLSEQLEEQAILFLSDKTRNRSESDVIKLSKIFKWYREDFEKGWLGYQRLEDFLLDRSDALGLADPLLKQLKAGKADIEFLDYDWRLNKK